MLTAEEIRTFIEHDAASTRKQLAQVGQRYYESDHDIKKHRIFFVDADGVLQEDKTKANTRISHPFFTENVDQVVQYLLSGDEAFIRSDDAALQAHLDEYFNENDDFKAELYEVLTGAVAKGFEYAYAFKDTDGRTHFQCADSLGVVEVRAKDTDDHCEYIIYSYIDRIEKNSKEIRRIEVWDATQTYFYCQVDDGEIVVDDSQQINPRPHTFYQKGNDGKLYINKDGYGRIPFFRLDNCRKQFSGLKPIKDLIDDYDLMNCGLSNNIHDTNEALYVVRGFEGDDLDELMQNIKAKKHIGVDENGGVDVKTVDIPVEARKAKMEIDEQNIYRFGMALNTHGLKDTAATTNIAIKSAYSLLDLKANKLQIRLKQFLRKLLDIVLAEINTREKTDFQQKDVYFCFKPEVPTNAEENARIELTEAQKRQAEINTLLSLEAQLGNEKMMELIAEQLDLDWNELKEQIPATEDADPYAASGNTGAEEGVTIE